MGPPAGVLSDAKLFIEPAERNGYIRIMDSNPAILRRSRPRWLGRIIEVAALGLAIFLWVEPLIRANGIWESHDIGFDIERGVGVIDAWRVGIWDARWFPVFDWGYGYPFLSFYAPLYHWITAIVLKLSGSIATAAWLGPAMWLIVG